MTPVSMSRDIRKKNDTLLKAVMAEWLTRWTWEEEKSTAHGMEVWNFADELSLNFSINDLMILIKGTVMNIYHFMNNI